MTRNSTFKRLVRERMASTGERYSTARGHVLAQRGATTAVVTDGSRTFPSVRAVGGRQPDLAAARNLCTNAGVVGPDGEPLSEALAFGLAGGIGFLYGVFEYADGPTMTIVARNKSMPDPFCEPLFARAGTRIEIETTTGTRKAGVALERAITAERPALCTVGSAALSYLGSGEAMEGSAPHVVGVIGATGGDVLLDDRAPEPIPVPRSEFDQARAGYPQAKHRLITVGDVRADHDWETAVTGAVVAGAIGFDTPPVPQFAANVGLAGLRKFERLLTDPKDPKGWSKVFGSGRRAAIGLSRLFDGIDHAYTSPSAGRPLYAEFLGEATAVGPDRGWNEAAARIRSSGDRWARIAALAAGAHPALTRFATLADERAAQLDGIPDPAVMSRAAAEQRYLIETCEISSTDASEAFAAIADLVAEIIELEEGALAMLRAD